MTIASNDSVVLAGNALGVNGQVKINANRCPASVHTGCKI